MEPLHLAGGRGRLPASALLCIACCSAAQATGVSQLDEPGPSSSTSLSSTPSVSGSAVLSASAELTSELETSSGNPDVSELLLALLVRLMNLCVAAGIAAS